MTPEEISEELSQKRWIPRKYLMGTKAYHQLGDISSDEPDLLVTNYETKNYYIGSWVTGFGFVEVFFPKETTRKLTDEELEIWDGKYIQISDQPPIKLELKPAPLPKDIAYVTVDGVEYGYTVRMSPMTSDILLFIYQDGESRHIHSYLPKTEVEPNMVRKVIREMLEDEAFD